MRTSRGKGSRTFSARATGQKKEIGKGLMFIPILLALDKSLWSRYPLRSVSMSDVYGKESEKKKKQQKTPLLWKSIRRLCLPAFMRCMSTDFFGEQECAPANSQRHCNQSHSRHRHRHRILLPLLRQLQPNCQGCSRAW